MLIRRYVYLVALGMLTVAALLILAVVRSGEPDEPVYKGKKLSEWVMELGQGGETGDRCEEAIVAIGTNALPCLVAWMAYQEPAWRAKLSSELARHHKTWNIANAKQGRAENAAVALRVLGQPGEAAVPMLVRLMNDPEALPNGRWRAAFSLGQLGVVGFSPLFAFATNQQSDIRTRLHAAAGLMFATNNQSAVPIFRQLCDDRNPDLRALATNALLRTGSRGVAGAEGGQAQRTNAE